MKRSSLLSVICQRLIMCELNMILNYIFVLLVSAVSASEPRRRCRFGDICWPSEATWEALNSSISGRLVRTFPPAAVCHGQTFDIKECTVAKDEWTNSFWRTNQTGAYTAIVWEQGLGNQQCFVNSSQSAPCRPGLGELHLDLDYQSQANKIQCPTTP